MAVCLECLVCLVVGCLGCLECLGRVAVCPETPAAWGAQEAAWECLGVGGG